MKMMWEKLCSLLVYHTEVIEIIVCVYVCVWQEFILLGCINFELENSNRKFIKMF